MVFAFLAMGGWAVFANHRHGLERAAISGLAQGTVSGLLTLGLKRFLEAAAARLPDVAAAILPPALTCVVVLIILLTVHHLAGTPDVWATISVPYAVSSSYAWVYSAMLVLGRRKAARLQLTTL